MTSLYSFNGAWPTALPFRVKLSDGTTRTDPATFAQAELEAWGYTGPFTPPVYDRFSEVLEWTGAAYSVRDMTLEERQAVLEEQWSEVRTQRNQLLQQSDWTQLADTPADKAAWADYRQQLRDITQQDDPFNVAWPLRPS